VTRQLGSAVVAMATRCAALLLLAVTFLLAGKRPSVSLNCSRKTKLSTNCVRTTLLAFTVFFNSKILHIVPHRVYLKILCDFYNKQLIFLSGTLTGWSL